MNTLSMITKADRRKLYANWRAFSQVFPILPTIPRATSLYQAGYQRLTGFEPGCETCCKQVILWLREWSKKGFALYWCGEEDSTKILLCAAWGDDPGREGKAVGAAIVSAAPASIAPAGWMDGYMGYE